VGRRSFALILVVAAATFAVAGCGGGGGESDTGEEAADCGAAPAAMSGLPQLLPSSRRRVG
jgi:hypothetical protein